MPSVASQLYILHMYFFLKFISSYLHCSQVVPAETPVEIEVKRGYLEFASQTGVFDDKGCSGIKKLIVTNKDVTKPTVTFSKTPVSNVDDTAPLETAHKCTVVNANAEGTQIKCTLPSNGIYGTLY